MVELHENPRTQLQPPRIFTARRSRNQKANAQAHNDQEMTNDQFSAGDGALGIGALLGIGI
jgi:hypothetical protein